MSYEVNKRKGHLVYNYALDKFDILFPDGLSWGGLELGENFEINIRGIWYRTSINHNGRSFYLVGIGGNGVPLKVQVRV